MNRIFLVNLFKFYIKKMNVLTMVWKPNKELLPVDRLKITCPVESRTEIELVCYLIYPDHRSILRISQLTVAAI